MAKVIAHIDKTTSESESVDLLLRKFKKKVANDNIIYECRRREFFVKKSAKRRLKSIEHQKLLRKKH